MTQPIRLAAQAPHLGPALRHWGHLAGREGTAPAGQWIRSDAQLLRGQSDRFQLDLLQVEQPGLQVHRTIDHIAKTAQTAHIIVIQLEGHSLLYPNDRDTAIALEPGSVSYGNPKVPYRWEFTEPMTLMMLRTTASAMPLAPGVLRPLVGQPFDATSGYAQLAIEVAKRILTDDQLLAGSTGSRVLNDVAGMFATMLTEALDHVETAQDPAGGQPALRRVMDYIESHLDTDLRVSHIAEALGMSTRYIQSLFQRQHLTASGWIRQRRLETVRNALIDPAWAHADIFDVACAHGFSDHSHFTRVFKAQFGLTPSQWRGRNLIS